MSVELIIEGVKPPSPLYVERLEIHKAFQEFSSCLASIRFFKGTEEQA